MRFEKKKWFYVTDFWISVHKWSLVLPGWLGTQDYVKYLSRMCTFVHPYPSINALKLFSWLQIPDCAWARVKYANHGQWWWCEAVRLPRDKLSQWVSTPPYFAPFCLPSPLLYVCTILLRLLFGPNLLPLFCEFAKQKWCIAGSRLAGWNRTRKKNIFWFKLSLSYTNFMYINSLK